MASNLRNILSEKKTQIESTDRIIVESDKGTTVSDFGNVVFNKDNFKFKDSIDNSTANLPVYTNSIEQLTRDKFKTIVAPEILSVFYNTHSNSQSELIGIEGISTTILPLCAEHVNTTRDIESNSNSLPISPDAGNTASSDGSNSNLKLSKGIYRVECAATFTLVGPPGGIDANGNPYGNVDKAYLILELFKFTSPHETLLVSTPIIDHGLATVDINPPSDWCFPPEDWDPAEQQIFVNLPSHTCYMYGFISICNPSIIGIKAHTAGTYVAGYPSPGNIGDLPPLYINPVQLTIEKISDDPFLFDISTPEVETISTDIESLSSAAPTEEILPQYKLKINKDLIREGENFEVTLTVENLPNNTRVPYIISGATVNDIDVSSLAGNFIIIDGKSTIKFSTFPNKTKNTLKISLINYPDISDTIIIDYE